MATGNSRRGTQDKVRGEYASGTGWEAGQIAPSTKYVDMDGKVSDSEPKGGGSVLVAEGDVVRPHMVEALKSGVPKLRMDNEHSPGDASHSRRGRRGKAADGTADDGTTPPSGAGTTGS